MVHSEAIFWGVLGISFTIEGINRGRTDSGKILALRCQMTALRSGRQRCAPVTLRDR